MLKYSIKLKYSLTNPSKHIQVDRFVPKAKIIKTTTHY